MYHRGRGPRNISGQQLSPSRHRRDREFQIVVTALKVALIVLFLYGGLRAFDASVIRGSLTDNVTNITQLGVTATLVFITSFGFEAIATNAEEIEEPGRNIPRRSSSRWGWSRSSTRSSF